MKCSTKTRQAIQKLLIEDLSEQIVEQKGQWLDDLEYELRRNLGEIGKQSLGALLSEYDAREYQSGEICACGGKAKRLFRRKAKLLSIFGWIEYRRGYYHCENCGRNEHRLDVAQGIKPGQASREMSKLMSMAGVTVSFSEASKQLAAYLLVDVSPNTIRKETYATGQRQAEMEGEEILNSENEERLQMRERRIAGEESLERVYGSMDGAQSPTTMGWREVKTMCWYQSQPRYGDPNHIQAVQIEYRSELSTAEEFGHLLWASALSYRADQAKELVFVCDGATWIWKLVERYFPRAVQIVDWYHACQYLAPIATTVYKQPQQVQAWLEHTTQLLWRGKLDQLLSACRLHQKYAPAKKFVEDAISYYTNNRSRMNYPAYREAGYFCGSGTVESACKQIVTARLKRSGARWLEDNVSLIAKARAAWLSGDLYWHALFTLPLPA